jgi:hypothetical protein
MRPPITASLHAIATSEHAVVVCDGSERTGDLQVRDFLTRHEVRRIGIETIGDKPRTQGDDERNDNDLGKKWGARSLH